MQFKVATLVAVFAVLGASAKPAHHSRTIAARDYQCQKGVPSCCNTINMKDEGLGKVLNPVGELLDGILDHLNDAHLIGWGCNPIDISGITQSNCPSHAVCCSDKTFEGLVVAACNPIDIL